MGRITLAFLYNVRHRYPDPADPLSQLETDFDDPQTIEIMKRYLAEAGFNVIPIEANAEAYLELYEHRKEISLAFNYSMGIHGNSRYAQIPAMLEMLQIPYTGSDPLTQGLIMNKARMQEVLASRGVNVLPSQVFRSPETALADGLAFPLIVKPIAQGSSAGITERSIVRDRKALAAQVKTAMETFGEPALVQPLLEGREFSVPMLGNPPEVLPFIEPDFSRLPDGYSPIDSLEVKWVFEEQAEENHLVCPARVDPGLADAVRRTALAAWDALSIRDLCRIDIRCDRGGRPFVLDVNSPPGLIPPEITRTSYFPLSARAAGIAYADLVKRILDIALSRTGVGSR